MKKSKRVFGFTIIELMITVTIIGILSVVGVVIFSEVQKGVRDAKRKQDLRTIQTSLEIYYQRNGRYPCTGFLDSSWQISRDDPYWIKDNNTGDINCGGKDLDATYIDVTPKDPKNGEPAGFPWAKDQFSYAYWAGNTTTGYTSPSCSYPAGQYYILMTKLEKDTDPEITRFKAYRYCDLPPGGPTEVIGTDIIPFNAYDLDKLYIITSQE